MSDATEGIEDLILGAGTRAELIGGPHGPGLAVAAELVGRSSAIGVVTGFTVPTVEGFAPETDGPPGAAALAAFLAASGKRSRLLTDARNQAVCEAAAHAYSGVAPVEVEVADTEADGAEVVACHGFDALVYVERVGANAHGAYLSMRAVDLTEVTAPLDRLIPLVARTVGIGDGGNEVGMGSVPAEVVARLDHGERIRCVVPTDALIVAGTSNWGAWSLMVALALADPTLAGTADAALAEGPFRSCVTEIVEAGAVDGVSGRPERSVDGRPLDEHVVMLGALRGLLGGG